MRWANGLECRNIHIDDLCDSMTHTGTKSSSEWAVYSVHYMLPMVNKLAFMNRWHSMYIVEYIGNVRDGLERRINASPLSISQSITQRRTNGCGKMARMRIVRRVSVTPLGKGR